MASFALCAKLAAAWLLITTVTPLLAVDIEEESPSQQELAFEAAFQGECRSNGPCQHLCFDLHDGTFECACREGFTLADNGYSCVENHLVEESERDDEKNWSGADEHENATSPGLRVKGRLIGRARKKKLQSTRRDAHQADAPQHDEQRRQTGDEKKGLEARQGSPSINELFNSCLEIECEAGGTCIEEENVSRDASATGPNGRKKRVRCRCPLGRRGFFCEKPSEVRFPRFRGNSYLALPTLRDAHKSMQVSIEFRPEHYEGLLLYSGEKQNLEGDFIALLLNQGFVEFRFDCGMGEGVVRSERPVILNSWNTVTVYRDGWTAWLQLNGGQQVSGQSQGLFSRITFRLELFLGGSPNLTLVSDRTNSFTGLTGCVRKLEINGRSFDFRSDNRGDAIDGIDIEECGADICSRTSCLNGGQCVASSPDKGICLCPLGFGGGLCETESDFTVPAFNGSSYLQYPGFGESLNLFFEIQIAFKPTEPNGLLLYNGNRMDGGGDFVSINLIDGFVEFRFNPGNGPAVIRSADPIAMDEWHTLLVSRTARLGLLRVDDQPEVGGYALGAFSQLSLPLNLFIGGISDTKDVSRDSGLTRSFSGCIQRVLVNGRAISLLEQALFGVNVADCSQPCTTGPCMHLSSSNSHRRRVSSNIHSNSGHSHGKKTKRKKMKTRSTASPSTPSHSASSPPASQSHSSSDAPSRRSQHRSSSPIPVYAYRQHHEPQPLHDHHNLHH